MEQATNFITSVGFPIALACGLCYVMYKVFMIIFSKFIDTLDKLSETNRILAEGVKRDIDDVKQDVKSILDIIKK